MGYVLNLRKLIGSRPFIVTGASVILLDANGRLLLQLRKDNNSWGLAGGSLEPGETLEEVARRELKEETGLIGKHLTFFKMFSGEEFYYKYPNGDEVYNVISTYICNDFKGELKAGIDEVQELNFFNLNEIPSNISPPDRKVIEEYIKQRLKPL